MFKFEIRKDGVDVLIKGLEKVNENLIRGSKDAMVYTLLDMQTTAKKPGYAPYKSGTLASSITHKINSTADKIIGALGSNVVYARIQEYGGEIKPKNGKYLKFKGRFGWVSVKSVTIRPKYYLTRAIKDNLPGLKRRLIALKLINKK